MFEQHKVQVILKWFKLNYLDAKKIAPMLTKLATSDAATKKGTGAAKAAVSIQAEETDNAIVIRAPRTVLRNLRSVIRKLDVRPGQVLVQAIIVRMDTHLLEELGVNWQTTGVVRVRVRLSVFHPMGLAYCRVPRSMLCLIY